MTPEEGQTPPNLGSFPALPPFAAAVAARAAGFYRGINQRNRAILNFFASSILSRGVSICCQLLQVPIALHYLGEEAFGLWITFSGFSTLLTVADFGIGLGAQNQIAEFYAVGDQRQARRVFLTASTALAGIGLLLVAIMVPVCLWVDWGRLLKLTNPATLHDVHGAAVLVAVFCAAGISLSMGVRLIYALQLAWINNFLNTACNLVTLGGVILTCRMHGSILTLFAVVFAPGLFLGLLMTAGLLRRLRWFDGSYGSLWSFDFFDFASLKKLLSVGLLFFVQQLCDLSLYTAPAILISSMLGAAAVTPFNIGQRLFSLFLVVQNAFLPPLWPAYSEAKAMCDWAWVRRTLRRSMLATLLLTVGPMALATIFGGPVLQLWIGKNTAVESLPTQTLLWLLFTWNMIVVLQQPYAFLLSGMSEVRRLSVYRIVTAVAAIGLMLTMGSRFGLPGIVAGLIGAMLISLLGGVLETRRFLRDAARQSAPPPPTILAAAS